MDTEEDDGQGSEEGRGGWRWFYRASVVRVHTIAIIKVELFDEVQTTQRLRAGAITFHTQLIEVEHREPSGGDSVAIPQSTRTAAFETRDGHFSSREHFTGRGHSRRRRPRKAARDPSGWLTGWTVPNPERTVSVCVCAHECLWRVYAH